VPCYDSFSGNLTGTTASAQECRDAGGILDPIFALNRPIETCWDGSARTLVRNCPLNPNDANDSGVVDLASRYASDPVKCLIALGASGVAPNVAFTACAAAAAAAPDPAPSAATGSSGTSSTPSSGGPSTGTSGASSASGSGQPSTGTTAGSSGASAPANITDPAAGNPCSGGDGTQIIGGVPCSYILQATQGSNINVKTLTDCMASNPTDAAGRQLTGNDLYSYCAAQQRP
jgi:hypothetical protein